MRISEPCINSYIRARSVLTRSKMEKDAKGKTSNEKCTNKKNILNYNDIISAPSTTIAIKKEELYLPSSSSVNPKEKKYIYMIHMKSINQPEDCRYCHHFK